MGIVNVTPDSFSDGGAYLRPEAAIAHGLALAAAGADILDIGGESTRPGAAAVSAEEELRRVLPVIEGLVAAGTTCQVSIDTSKAEVAERALMAGATMVNDVTALGDPELATVCAEAEASLVLMHMQGTPRTMQEDPTYDDVVSEVRDHLAERVGSATSAGVPEEMILIDPGIGFGKTADHNLALLARLDVFVGSGFPVLIGTSRKGFLGRLLGQSDGGADATPVDDRLEGSVATATWAMACGVTMVRAHDVAATVAAAQIVAGHIIEDAA